MSVSAVALPSSNRMTRFVIEYAKSDEETCKACSNVIEKGVVRVGREVETKDQTVINWEHLHCLSMNYATSMVAKHGAVANVPGFNNLKQEDREALIPAIEKIAKGTDPGEAIPKFLIGPHTASNLPGHKDMKKKDILEQHEKEERAALDAAQKPQRKKKGKRSARKAEQQADQDGQEGEEEEEEGSEEEVTLEEGEALVMEEGEDGALHKAKKTIYKAENLDLPFETTSAVV